MAARVLIQIGGQTVEASSVTLPASGRNFRDAWQLNGSVVEIDMDAAKTIRIEALLREADEAAQAAEKSERIARARGNAQQVAFHAAEKARLRGNPASVNSLLNATTPDELLAVTIADMFP